MSGAKSNAHKSLAPLFHNHSTGERQFRCYHAYLINTSAMAVHIFQLNGNVSQLLLEASGCKPQPPFHIAPQSVVRYSAANVNEIGRAHV